MATLTTIPWCNRTFNPWEGCTEVSPGCVNCYARTRNRRFSKGKNWGRGAPRRHTTTNNWALPPRWNRLAGRITEAYGADYAAADYGGDPLPTKPIRPRVFCASLADWLDAEVPIEWLADLLNLIRCTPHLDWLMLTKRPQNWRPRLEAALDHLVQRTPVESCTWLADWLGIKFRGACNAQAPRNVWIGTTVEDQARADERLPILLSIPAKVRFLSCEPLLENVNLLPWLGWNEQRGYGEGAGIHWVIAGCESGQGRREMPMSAPRAIAKLCAKFGVAFFMKQLICDGKVTEEIQRFPAPLQVRQFPEVCA